MTARFGTKLSLGLSLAVVLALLLAPLALADPITNNIDTTVDPSLEVRTITSGGSTSVGFYDVASNSDPSSSDASGCNSTGAAPSTVTLNVPANVTATPMSFNLTGCGTGAAVPVTFTSNIPGSYTVSVASVTGGKAGSQWNTAPASFTLVVNPPPDSTPPVISYTVNGVYPAAPDGDNGWYVTDAFVDWTVTDLESSFTTIGCADTNISGDTNSTTLSCSATSDGGTAGPVTVTIKRDATAPGVAVTPDRVPDYNGWYNYSVDFTTNGTDPTSDIANCSALQTYNGPDGSDLTVSGSCTDNAGNVGNGSSAAFNYDATAPTITGSASPAANGNGWNNTDVAVSFNCSDATSGVASCGPNQTLSSESADQSAPGTAVDNAGNSASYTVSGINIDKTAPTISLVGGPANGGSYYFGSVPAAPTCSASDALSGLDGACSVTGYSTALGPHTVTASATDKAGNSASASATYTVLAWTLNGFYQPVDMGNVYNTVRGGSTVPLKFEVFAGSTELTATSVVQSFVQTRIACNTSATIDEIEVTTTGGTSLRYDTTAGQFVQNWQTPRQPGYCYRVTMTTQDGSSLFAFFKLK